MKELTIDVPEGGSVAIIYNFHEFVLPKLCEYMGIDVAHFHSYHAAVGGKYKNCWHAWLDIHDGLNISNGVIIAHSHEDEDSTTNEYLVESLASRDKAWHMEIYKAMDKLFKEFGTGESSDEMYISYAW